MANILIRCFAWLLFERNTKGKSYADNKRQLEESATLVQSMIDEASDNEKSRQELLHIIGMERWMQSRMKVVLGEPFTQEEYDGYRPPEDAGWQDLKQAFIQTRHDSYDICDALATKNVDGSQTVTHNQLGELSIRAWMEYMLIHSRDHAKRMT